VARTFFLEAFFPDCALFFPTPQGVAPPLTTLCFYEPEVESFPPFVVLIDSFDFDDPFPSLVLYSFLDEPAFFYHLAEIFERHVPSIFFCSAYTSNSLLDFFEEFEPLFSYCVLLLHSASGRQSPRLPSLLRVHGSWSPSLIPRSVTERPVLRPRSPLSGPLSLQLAVMVELHFYAVGVTHPSFYVFLCRLSARSDDLELWFFPLFEPAPLSPTRDSDVTLNVRDDDSSLFFTGPELGPPFLTSVAFSLDLRFLSNQC